MHLDSFDEVKRLTKEMVAIPSINKVPLGETAVAKYVYDYFMNMDYFKKKPNQVKMFKTIDDSPDRHSTYAYIKGTKGNCNKTVILLSHTDTVGIDDYGTIKDLAFNVDALPAKFLEMNVSDIVKEDIASGKFMFGRGTLDMKSGVAGHMFLIKYFAAHPEELDGNLLALAVCDEEDMSKGVISALDELVELKNKEGFDYTACINAGYSTNYNPGDENRYIYYGCIGKTLPTFVAFGKEAHVGQSFAALDPNLLIAEITKRMSLNTDLCDIAHGEVTMPPISLKQTDTKVGYTVQTALVAMGYYNFFTHAMNPGQVLDKSKKVAEDAFDAIIEYLNVQYKKFCDLSSISYAQLPWKRRVYTWKEFYDFLVATAGNKFVTHMDAFGKKLHESDPGMDLRQYGFKMCQEAWTWSKDKSPAIVVFFGSLYSTNIEMTGKTQKDKDLKAAVDAAIEKVAPKAERQLKTRMFYPYIADSSFMAVGGDPSIVNVLNENMPSTKHKYRHDIEKIVQIDVPVVNIGSFGRDGFMATERVDMKQTFENVPNISYETIKALLR